MKPTWILPTVSWGALLLAIVATLPGCRGNVVVGTPQVFTRERLVEERMEEEVWLKKKLNDTPSTVAFQGLRDVRDFTGVHQELRATFDPAQASPFKLDHEIEKTNKTLELAKAKHKLDLFRSNVDQQSQASSEESESAKSSSAPTPVSDEIPEPKERKISSKTDELRSGAMAQQTTAEPGSLDLLHDQLAFRNTVLAANRERQLDDAHDIPGSALYDFQFDVTLKPNGNDDKYAQVLVKLADPLCPDASEQEKSNAGSTSVSPQNGHSQRAARTELKSRVDRYQIWKKEHERLLNDVILERQTKYLRNQLTRKEKAWLEQTIHVDLPKLERLFTEIGKLLPSNKDLEEEKEKTPKESDAKIKIIPNQDENFTSIFEGGIRELRPKGLSGRFRAEDLSSNEETLIALQISPAMATNLDFNAAVQIFKEVIESLKETQKEKEDDVYLIRMLLGVKDITRLLQSIIQELKNVSDDDLVTFKESNKESIADRAAAVLLAIAWGVFEDEQWINSTSVVRQVVQLAPPFLNVQQVAKGIAGSGPKIYPQITLITPFTTSQQVFDQHLCKDSRKYIAVKAVEPKEYAHNISDLAAYENLLVQVASLRAIVPQYGVKGDGYVERVHQRQEYLQSILRKPLAIGFGEGQDHFGWILGPRFTIDSSPSFLGSLRNFFYTPSPVSFTHEPVRHTVRAAAALPVWIDTIKLCTKTGWLGDWLDPSGVALRPESIKDCGHRNEITLPLPVHRDRWRALSNYLNPRSRYLVPEPEVTYPLRGGDRVVPAEPEVGNPTPPVIFIPEGETFSTHKQGLLIRGRNLWRNPQVFLGPVQASSVRILSDMDGLYATFEFVDKDKNVLARLGDDGDKVDLRVTTSVGTDLVERAVKLVEASRPQAWPVARLEVPRLIAKDPKSSLAFSLDSKLNRSQYSSLHLYARNVSKPTGWHLFNGPVKISADSLRLEVCDGLKIDSNQPACAFDVLRNGAQEAFEMQVRLGAKLANGDADTKTIAQDTERRVVFFKMPDHREGNLSAPAAHELTLTKTKTKSKSEEKPDQDVYSVDNPISVTLPIYDENPDLFLVAYPGLRQGINKNAVRVVLVSSTGYTIALPAQYQKGPDGQHQFTVPKNDIEKHGATISTSPSGIDYLVFLEFGGEPVPVKSRLKIKA